MTKFYGKTTDLLLAKDSSLCYDLRRLATLWAGQLTRKINKTIASSFSGYDFELITRCARLLSFFISNYCCNLCFTMFNRRRYALSGPAFNDRYKDVSARDSVTYETLTRYAVIMSPKKWSDNLTAHQASQFHYITAKHQLTTKLTQQIEEELEQVPCLAMALTGEYDDLFLVLSTFAGRVLCFSLRMLADRLGGLDQEAYSFVVPAKVNEWLRRETLYKLGTRTPDWLRHNQYGFVVRTYVETSAVFLHFQVEGNIPPQDPATN